MNFASDNVYGVSDKVLAGLAEANRGTAGSYGSDEWTERLQARFAEIFEHEVTVFPVATGTAANVLSLAELCPPHGAVFCHDKAHVMVDECGAFELFSGGAKLVGIAGETGTFTASALGDKLGEHVVGHAQHAQPAAVSITQASETGRVYTPEEVAAISTVAKAHGMALHMDGARFANAVAGLGCSPADLTWRAGVEALSFGATKNGGLSADAIVFFDGEGHETMPYRITKAGHMLSKSRFMAAQLLAYLEDGLWLELARQANARARQLADGIAASNVARLAWPAQANEVFAVMPRSLAERLWAAGAVFHAWPYRGLGDGAGEGELLARMVTSFATPGDSIEAFLERLVASDL